MSVHKRIKILPIVLIALASLFIAACSNTTSNASSISITATPVAATPVAQNPVPTVAIENRAPSAQELEHPNLPTDSTLSQIPTNQLGAESRRSFSGGGETSPAGDSPAVPTALPPTIAPTDAPTATPKPIPPTIAPPPTAEPTEAPVQPVTTDQNYVVRRGDTLNTIAARTGVPAATIMQMNGIKNANWIYVGQVLRIKATVQAGRAPSTKLVPDSEAVYSPAYQNFDFNGVARQFGGYLNRYQENVEGRMLTGPQIVELVSSRFSIGPRVLLTILEMQGGWVTGNPPTLTQLYYPMGLGMASWSGLYRQLWYAADQLNSGYYGRVYDPNYTLAFGDGTRLALSSKVNPGTAAIQNYFSQVSTYATWSQQIGPDGFSATYKKLFGDPFAHAIEPLIPANLTQPTLHLPWEEGATWWFTGGPHGGWADGSAWAAIDFAPSQGSGTCWPSAEWDTAAAPGVIVTVETGRVMQNLDGKNFQGSGWVLMYMHVGSAGRVNVGDVLKTGDHVGHPSCEGGVSTADHLHFARLYNGQWIAAADRQRPMVLSGWKFAGGSSEYDGSATRGPDYMEAYNGHAPQLNSVVSDDGPVRTTADNSDTPANGPSEGATNGVLAGMSPSVGDPNSSGQLTSGDVNGQVLGSPASPTQPTPAP